MVALGPHSSFLGVGHQAEVNKYMVNSNETLQKEVHKNKV